MEANEQLHVRVRNQLRHSLACPCVQSGQCLCYLNARSFYSNFCGLVAEFVLDKSTVK